MNAGDSNKVRLAMMIDGLAKTLAERQVPLAPKPQPKPEPVPDPEFECDCCGAPIYRAGLCGSCREAWADYEPKWESERP